MRPTLFAALLVSLGCSGNPSSPEHPRDARPTSIKSGEPATSPDRYPGHFGLLGDPCPDDRPVSTTRPHCNEAGAVVMVDLPDDQAPAIPKDADFLFTHSLATVALHGDRLWLRRSGDRAWVASLPDLDGANRRELKSALGLPDTLELVTAIDWKTAVLTSRVEPFDKLGSPCAGTSGAAAMFFDWCGAGNRVSRINRRGSIGVPLRAEPVGRVTIDGDVIYYHYERCPRCRNYTAATWAADTSLLTSEQADTLAKLLGLSSTPADIAAWRAALAR